MASCSISRNLCAFYREFEQRTGEESALCPIVTRICQILKDGCVEINKKILQEPEKYVWKKSTLNITLLQFSARPFALEVAPKPFHGKEAGKKLSYSNHNFHFANLEGLFHLIEAQSHIEGVSENLTPPDKEDQSADT